MMIVIDHYAMGSYLTMITITHSSSGCGGGSDSNLTPRHDSGKKHACVRAPLHLNNHSNEEEEGRLKRVCAVGNGAKW